MKKAIIHWKLGGGVIGHGAPMSLINAREWCKVLNEQHGSGTHWWKVIED